MNEKFTLTLLRRLIKGTQATRANSTPHSPHPTAYLLPYLMLHDRASWRNQERDDPQYRGVAPLEVLMRGDSARRRGIMGREHVLRLELSPPLSA